jgi:iron complex outermembrane receptor protein
LTLTVGLRLDYEQQEVRHTSVTSSPTLGGTVLQSFQYADEQSFHAALPKASLSWSWTRSQFSYASVSRGYKGGGYNQTPNVEADIAGGYDPEYATVYELGHRADLLDRRLSLNTAVYHTDYTNKQVVILESPRFYFENAGRARIRGGEVELQAKAAPGLEIFANLGVIHTEITRYDVPVGTGTDLTGKRLSMAPSYDGYLGLQYRHTTGIFLRPDLQLVGDYAADTDNNIIQAPYRKLGLRVGYEWPQAAVYLWGRNLNDAEYLTRGSTTSFPGAQRLVGVGGEPRTLGASAQFEF